VGCVVVGTARGRAGRRMGGQYNTKGRRKGEWSPRLCGRRTANAPLV